MTTLGRSQVQEFHEQGFTLVRGVFSAAEMVEMRAAFERLEAIARELGRTTTHRGSQFVIDPLDGGRIRIQRIVWCGAAEPVLSEFGADPRLLGMSARLLASDSMQQLINQAHFKLPGDGVEFPWHQDSTHRRYGQDEWRDLNGRGSYVQTATAIDEMDEDNGPLTFLPGSGKLGHLDLPPDGRLPEGLDPGRAEVVPMRPGDVVLFGPFTVHRSLPNRSTRPRRVFINGYAYPGANARVYPGEGAGRLLHASQDGR
jgi:ectoine hydroxylase-related dioxygenase (phytanoyl-CoA dioxygenase family)